MPNDTPGNWIDERVAALESETVPEELERLPENLLPPMPPFWKSCPSRIASTKKCGSFLMHIRKTCAAPAPVTQRCSKR